MGLLQPSITHDDFMTLVAPAFAPGIPEQHFMAICKRSLHVVFLRDRAFVRHPCETKQEVKQVVYPFGVVDLLTEECTPTLGAYKRGEAVSNPEMVSRNRRWSEVLVRKVMSGEVVKEFIEENKDVPKPIPSDGPAETSHTANAVELVPAQHVKIEPSVGSGARSSADRLVTDDVQLHDRSDIGDQKRVKRTTGAWNIRLNPSILSYEKDGAIMFPEHHADGYRQASLAYCSLIRFLDMILRGVGP